MEDPRLRSVLEDPARRFEAGVPADADAPLEEEPGLSEGTGPP